MDEFPVEAWDELLSIDLTGVFLMSRAVIPHMKAAGHRRAHHQYRLRARAGADAAAELLRGGQGGRREPDALHGAGTRAAQILVNGIAPGSTATEGWAKWIHEAKEAQDAHARLMSHIPLARPGHARRRSRTARFSWPRRRVPTSPATSWRSTAAGPPASPATSSRKPAGTARTHLTAGRRCTNTPPLPDGLDASEPAALYRQMVLLRRFELAAQVACRKGETPGFLHLYIGQEATAVGICAHLRPTRLDHLHASRTWPRAWPRAWTRTC